MHIVQFRCIDDRSQGSIGSSAPIGAEASCDFTMNNRGTQGSLAAVIGGINVRSIQEDKQALAVFAESALQTGGIFLAQGAFEQPVANLLDPLDLFQILFCCSRPSQPNFMLCRDLVHVAATVAK